MAPMAPRKNYMGSTEKTGKSDGNLVVKTWLHGSAKSLDGVYTRLLRNALNIHWTTRTTDADLYKGIPKVTVRLRARRLQFAGHCFRSNEHAPQPVSDLVLAVPRALRRGQGARLTYPKMLARDVGVPVADLAGYMSHRENWRKLVSSGHLVTALN